MTDEQHTAPTAARAVRAIAGEIGAWKDRVPGPYRDQGLPSVAELGDHLASLNSLQFHWISTASFRATQQVSDPQHRDLTAAQALAAGLLGEVLGKLSAALSASARLSVLDLRDRALADRLRERITRRGNLALAQAHTCAEQAVTALASHARHLDERYADTPLLTHEQRAEAALAASAPAASSGPATAVPVTPPVPAPTAARRKH